MSKKRKKDDHANLVYAAENAITSLNDLLGFIDGDAEFCLDDTDPLIAHLEGVIWWYWKVYGSPVR